MGTFFRVNLLWATLFFLLYGHGWPLKGPLRDDERYPIFYEVVCSFISVPSLAPCSIDRMLSIVRASTLDSLFLQV